MEGRKRRRIELWKENEGREEGKKRLKEGEERER